MAKFNPHSHIHTGPQIKALAARARELEKLAERVARLNPAAGEIGPGMLASLVAEARRLTVPATLGGWKIRYARSLSDAEEAITMARATGSVGGKTFHNGELVADVVQLNPDGSERVAGT